MCRPLGGDTGILRGLCRHRRVKPAAFARRFSTTLLQEADSRLHAWSCMRKALKTACRTVSLGAEVPVAAQHVLVTPPPCFQNGGRRDLNFALTMVSPDLLTDWYRQEYGVDSLPYLVSNKPNKENAGPAWVSWLSKKTILQEALNDCLALQIMLAFSRVDQACFFVNLTSIGHFHKVQLCLGAWHAFVADIITPKIHRTSVCP